MTRTALYPGTFDPITNGHLDIIKRTLKQYDRVIIAVSDHAKKKSLFSAQERLALAKEVLADFANVEVISFTGLVGPLAAEQGAQAIIRGLRVSSDFEYEFRMHRFIKEQAPDVDLVYFMAGKETLHISSSAVREVASLGGDVRGYVPQSVLPLLQAKFN